MAIREYLGKNNERLFEVYVGVRSVNGKNLQARKKAIKTLKQAQQLEFSLKHKLLNQADKKIFTFEEFHKIFVERVKLEFLPTTVREYEGQIFKWVYPLWKDLEIQTIKPKDVHDLIFRKVDNVTLGTKRNILKKLKRIFQTALEDGIIDSNPALPIKVKVPETKLAVLNSAEVNKLLREAKLLNHRFYPIWVVAVLTGMRSGELYALKWTDVDFDSKRISVNKSWNNTNGVGPTKSSRNRIVPISHELEIFLKELKLSNLSTEGHVLPHWMEWTHGDQAKVLREFCSQIGITSIRFHDLRATFITQLLLNSVPLAQVMAIVGHSELKTTNEYLRIVGADLDGATDKLKFSIPTDELAKVIDLIKI